MQIPFISSLFHYFKYFYGYAGRKLFFLFFIIICGGLSEGLGISLLLPVLDFEPNTEAANAYSQIIYNFLEFIRVGVSLPSLLFLVFTAFILKGIFYFSQVSITFYIFTDLVKNIRTGFINKYAAMDYSFYTSTDIGYLNNVVTIETDKAVAGLEKYTSVMVSIVFISVYVSAAFVINSTITTLVLGISLIMFYFLRKLSGILREMSIRITDTNARIQSLLIQLIYNFKYLKATNGFTYLSNELGKYINKNCQYTFKSGVIHAIPTSIVEPSAILFMSGIITYYVAYQGQPMAEIMILLFFFYRTFIRIYDFPKAWQRFNTYIGSIEVVKKTTKDLHIHKEATGSHIVSHFEKDISLREIDFSYNRHKVINNVSLVIPKNKSIGIVGESGAGKTTLFDLLTGLIIPQSGNIVIDGVDYRALNLSSLRNIIGYVTQEPVIFNDTIANNISFWVSENGDKSCTERVKKAAKLANCLSFVNEKQNGYNAIIGDKGIKLSGGQRQRIAIARELFKDPEIMIFDEATSSLDTESEKLIQQSINSMKGKRTIVIISHRLSTIRDCDYIFVLNKGRIIEEGSFDELYGDKYSRFYSMCQAQNL